MDLPLRPLTGTCPDCGTRRGWGHAVCPGCGRRIGRELLVASIAVLAAIAFANTLGLVWAVVPYFGFLVLTVALGITDIAAFRIVDRLNLRGTLILAVGLGLAALADGNGEAWVRGVLGGAAYFAGTNLMFLAVRGRGFGYGDVKLSVQLGLFTAYLSWGTLGWSIFLTALVGGLISVAVLGAAMVANSRRRRAGGTEATVRDAMKSEVPYGPAMILGAWIAIILVGLGAIPIPT